MGDVLIFGASGYSGLELLRLLARHPVARVVAASSDSLRGVRVKARLPEWRTELEFSAHEAVLGRAAGVEVALLATPARTSADLAPKLLDRGVSVIDLSGAHRLDDPAVFREWYGFEHPHPERAAGATYGLVELFPRPARLEPGRPQLIANPGCYATAAIMAAAPLLTAGLVEPGAPLTIDGKSGATGAGRTLEEKLLFSEVAESVRPYRVARHQHTPEIERALSLLARRPVLVSFTAHLVPMRRGLLASVYALARAGVKQVDLDAAFAASYANQALVRVLTDRPPETGIVAHTGFVEVGATLDARVRQIAAFAAIDNLGKGAAGQAIQNLNALLGIDLGTGLT